MADVSDALYDLVPVTVTLKTLSREIDDDGIMLKNTNPATTVFTDARVIPTDPKEIDISEQSATSKIFYSFYFFGSVPFKVNDIIEWSGQDYKISKGWDRNLNGGYTKIIAGIQQTEAYTDA
jgi:hypothetical protein